MDRYVQTGATGKLADYIVAAQPGDLPANVRREALRAFLNIMGCAIGGSQHEIVGVTQQALAAFFGPPQATIIGRGCQADLLHASLLNALSSSVHTFDDTHAEAIVHPSGPVLAAILALSEQRPVTGRDALLSFALGVETICRISKAISVAPACGTIAWSQTGIGGGIGAAVAAAKLLGVDARTMRAAIGIVACQSGGFRVAHGTMSTPMMAAQAAQTGLRAAILAQGGFQGPLNVLEGKYGYLSVFSESAHVPALLDGLGQEFKILRDTYKPYPCGIVIHPAIEACLRLRQDHGVDAREVDRVHVRACEEAIALTDRRHPADELQAHVSLHYWAAVALTRGRAGVKDMDAASLRDPALAALQDRITLTATPGIAPDAIEVTATLKDGREVMQKIDHCIGSTGRPMTDAELETKFRDLAEGLIGAERCKAMIETCRNIETLADVGAIPRALA